MAVAETQVAVSQRKEGLPGLRPERYFSTEGVSPFDEIDWQIVDSEIKNEVTKEVSFYQRAVEAPKGWSMNAIDIFASKYLRGKQGTPARETSIRQAIDRVVNVYREKGLDNGYFTTDRDADIFADELRYLLVNQHFSFNSPVWFNVGVREEPQCSACFILKVSDDMPSILEWFKNEGMIFKGGSGSGLNVSPIRSSKEQLSGGGYASGPVSFMRGADSVAGSIKSGGTTRRAAKMVILDSNHPDVREFIWCKAHEERKAHVLGYIGYDMDLESGRDSISIQYQNANNSVRANDKFMELASSVDDKSKNWALVGVSDKNYIEMVNARGLLREIAEAAWQCGDPGMQFHDTINRWHTCPVWGPINGSNPCSEYMHVDNSACNLASLNLMRFQNEDGTFQVERFKRAVDIVITAMEISISFSGFPTSEIKKTVQALRELGLGYTNLGGYLISLGIPYDSDEGRAIAASITSIMCGEAYAQSARMSRDATGPFPGFEQDKEGTLQVLDMHREASYKINPEFVKDSSLVQCARTIWDETVELARAHGVRNSQATVQAPTGTISFMMDSDTTGMEPAILLVVRKKLVGGGKKKLEIRVIPLGLKRLGYSPEEIEAIGAYIQENARMEGAPFIKPEHLTVFDTAFESKGRSISAEGHIDMMAAIQPFLSGAISKTVNLPASATVEDVMNAYIRAWNKGVKAVAIYRDGSKQQQPLSGFEELAPDMPAEVADKFRPLLEEAKKRKKLPPDRVGKIKSIDLTTFDNATYPAHVIAGEYPNGELGEVYANLGAQGSTVRGWAELAMMFFSYCVQCGLPLPWLLEKMRMRFEPYGMTNDPEIGEVRSQPDMIAKWLAKNYLPKETHAAIGLKTDEVKKELTAHFDSIEKGNGGTIKAVRSSDNPLCPRCGVLSVRTSSCFHCNQCGMSFGSC
jgi:ribonucleoside-diphosphate reductase alpha chain